MVSLVIDQLPITFLSSFTTCSQKPIWQTVLQLCCSPLVPEDEVYPLSQHTKPAHPQTAASAYMQHRPLKLMTSV